MSASSKKIAFVSNTSWSLYNFRLQVFEYLQSKGYKVLLIAPKDEFTSKLIAKGFDFKAIKFENYGANPFDDFKLFKQLSKIYRSEKPDLIYHYTIKPNIYGSFAAFKNKVPSILITTGFGHLFDFKNSLVSFIAKNLYRVAANLSKEVWFLNSEDRDIFINKRFTTSSKAKILEGEGIDLKHFKRVNQIDNQGFRFLFAGRLLKDKGILDYISAAKTIKKEKPDIEFNVLGFINESNPNSIKYSELLAAQREGHIKYLGETTDVRPYLENSDCLVFPSYYKEGASRILMEAAALETPIITTDNVGCRQIIDNDKTGFLIPIKNQKALIKTILDFIKLSKGEREKLGTQGRKRMKEMFDIQLVKKEYLVNIKKYLS